MQYYIAIVAPPHIDETVLQWKKYMREQYGCKVALKSPAHITLIAPFHMEPEKEETLSNYLQSFTEGENRFPIHLSQFDAFKPGVIFVALKQNKPLAGLQQRLEDYLVSLGGFPFKKEKRPFHPHITIANRDIEKKDFRPAWDYFRKLHYEASFDVEAVSLLRHNKINWEIARRFALSGNENH